MGTQAIPNDLRNIGFETKKPLEFTSKNAYLHLLLFGMFSKTVHTVCSQNTSFHVFLVDFSRDIFFHMNTK